MTKTLTRLHEEICIESTAVDRESGVIRGVRILGRESKNGRIYSESAMKQAAKAYDNLGVNLNHPTKVAGTERSVSDGIGWLESIQIKPDGVYGDLHYFKEHPQSGLIAEAAERNPKRFGLSHNAEGRMERRDGKNVVESIETVHSVDIVQNPATNSSLFESEEQPMKITLKEYVAGIDAKHKGRASLVKLTEEMGMGEMPMEAAPAEVSADDQAMAAFNAMITAVAADTSLDLAAKKKRINEILGMQDKLLNPKEEAPAETPAAEPAAESKKTETNPMLNKLTEQVAEQGKKLAAIESERDQLKTEKACRALLESKNRNVDETRLTALAAMPEAARLKLVESWPEKVKESTDKPKPKFSRPITESTGVKPETITDGKSLAAALLN